VLSARYIKTTGYDLRLKTGKGYPPSVPAFLFYQINPLKTKQGPLYLKTQSVPRC